MHCNFIPYYSLQLMADEFISAVYFPGINMRPHMVSSQKTCKIKTKAKPHVVLLVALSVFRPPSIKHCENFRHGKSDSSETVNVECNSLVCEKFFLCLSNIS